MRGHKVAVLHRGRPLPLAIRITIVRYAAVGTHARTGNHPQFGVLLNKRRQLLTRLGDAFCYFHALRQWITLGNIDTSKRYCMTTNVRAMCKGTSF
jgi:hypothetical protein